jgi:hypothetical protein
MSVGSIAAIEAAYLIAVLAAFRWLRPDHAAAASFIGGWLLLPVGVYPSPAALSIFGEVIGLALPGQIPLSKAAVVAASTCLGSLLFDRARWLALRWTAFDIAMALFCAWPIAQGLIVPGALGLATTPYLLAGWGGTWLIGRLYVDGERGALVFCQALGIAGLVLVPVALLELVYGPFLYRELYGFHPYQGIGVSRYFGARPLALFEDGNQFGLWAALTAFAAIVAARAKHFLPWLAAVLVAQSIASQSVGAILLLLAGAVLVLVPWRVPRWAVGGAAVVLIAGGALYVSGVVPLDHLARQTAPGRAVLHGFRVLGRGSLPWRISQDQKVLPLAKERLVTGHGRWDWWRPAKTRPWGLPMLLLGQFGLVALLLSAFATLGGAVQWLLRNGRAGVMGGVAICVLLASVDAALNSFIFFPAIVLAGGLAASLQRRAAASEPALTE